MADAENLKKTEELARDVLRLARNSLLVNLRFMDVALSRMAEEPWPEKLERGCMTTDGETVFFHAPSVLRAFKEERTVMTRNYLHTIFHCVFQHPFMNTLMDHDCWDLACDIAVEHAINELGGHGTEARRAALQGMIIGTVKSHVKYMTAEHIYRYYLDLHLPPEQLQSIGAPFRGDDHTAWYLTPVEIEGAGGGAHGDRNAPQRPGIRISFNGDGDGEPQDGNGDSASRAATKQFWSDVAQRMQTDLETFSKQRGDTAGSLTQNLKAVNREKYDYADFLWHFTTLGEAMKINDDEFDYIFYTYGLTHYNNMPLIEPLEYKDVRRIKEFVIAIDTSGSVQGELVQKFIQKTYNILKQQESFFTRIDLHIIQCDAEIQEDARITTQEEFDAYLKTMTLRGFGGTDFRPVFEYVDKLRRDGELRHLKGLIYFTDGYGVFPEIMPEYLTAFVFVDDSLDTPSVPVWAIKLVLPPDEI